MTMTRTIKARTGYFDPAKALDLNPARSGDECGSQQRLELLAGDEGASR